LRPTTENIDIADKSHMIQKLERNSSWKDHTRSNKQQKAPSAASIYSKKEGLNREVNSNSEKKIHVQFQG